MGRMKEFGMQLARMVYHKRMTDEAIIKQFTNESPRPPEDWLREQIKTVRNNPKMWRDYANRS